METFWRHNSGYLINSYEYSIGMRPDNKEQKKREKLVSSGKARVITEPDEFKDQIQTETKLAKKVSRKSVY